MALRRFVSKELAEEFYIICLFFHHMPTGNATPDTFKKATLRHIGSLFVYSLKIGQKPYLLASRGHRRRFFFDHFLSFHLQLVIFDIHHNSAARWESSL